MIKHIAIIGGGISGLAVLHYLNQKYAGQTEIQIRLFEKNSEIGGTIQTQRDKGYIFETGPNGFLDSKPRTLQFLRELKLDEAIIQADEEANLRYILVNQKLHPVPLNPDQFLASPLFSLWQKLRVLLELFIPKGQKEDETVYEFGRRRLGEGFASRMLDPMVSGIYGGDAKSICLKSAFLRIYALEQEYGSLLKAMIQIKRQRGKKGAASAMPKGRLTSLEKGMSQIIETLDAVYRRHILVNQNIGRIRSIQERFVIEANGVEWPADEIFLSTPAHAAADLLSAVDARLSQALKEIPYAPMAVVGLVYPEDAFHPRPRGFGYLIPSSERRLALGALFESNIFPRRCPDQEILLRVMLGGSRCPDILNKTKQEIIDLAAEETHLTLHPRMSPKESFLAVWPQAIPQYDRRYAALIKIIEERLGLQKNLHLAANYWKGISFNDCVENAWQVVMKNV